MTRKTPQEAIQAQLDTILKAIELLQAAADDLTSTIDLDSVNWSHVGAYAHAADAAGCVIERLS